MLRLLAIILTCMLGVMPATAQRDSVSRRPARQVSVTGRLLFDLNTVASDRTTFVTPSTGLRLGITGLPGGTEIHTDVRYSYRYSSRSVVQPASALRLYDLSVSRNFTGTPFGIIAGRFYSPYESFSGYWDGFLLQARAGSVRLGVATGFLPNDWDQAPNMKQPRISGMANYLKRTERLTYRTDLSVHFVQGDGLFEDHSFAGWSQRLSTGPLLLYQTFQVDRDPSSGNWIVSRLILNSSFNLLPGLAAHARYGLRQTYSMWRGTQPFMPRQDQAGGGLSYYTSDTQASLDYSRATVTGANGWHSVSGSLYQMVFGISAGASAGLWDSGNLNTRYLAPSATATIAGVRTTLGYRIYTSSLQTNMQGIDLSLSSRIGQRTNFLLGGRTYTGQGQTSFGLFASLWIRL